MNFPKSLQHLTARQLNTEVPVLVVFDQTAPLRFKNLAEALYYVDLKSYIGPMADHDRTPEKNLVLRFETKEAYDRLSR